MIFTCKCGQKLKVNNPPQKKLKVVCPSCGYANIVINQEEKEVCFICGKTCIESNLLQNGMRYHQECLDKLESKKTTFDEKIRKAQNSLSNVRSEIRQVFNQRSFFQKLFSVVPESVEDLKERAEYWTKQISIWNEEKNQILIDRAKELRKVYDYWLTKPPDWKPRSLGLRQRQKYCMNCGRSATPDNPLQVHHIIPVSHGGNHKAENLKVLCLKCHQKEHPFNISKDYQENSSSSNQSNHYSALIDKIEKSKKDSLYISFKYRRFEGVRDKHLVQAEKLISKDDGMYFTGFCYLSNTSRDFKLKNMYKIELKESLPGPRLPADYIKEALERKLMMHCHYTKRTGGKSLRTLKPIGYTTFHGVKVLECYDYLTEENRCFAPHRMAKIELVKEPKESKVITGTP